MIEIEVLIDNFKDVENFNKPLKVIRDGKEITLMRSLLQKKDRYFMSKERFAELSSKHYVQKVQKLKEDKEE